MADVGRRLGVSTLFLTRGRDFTVERYLVGVDGKPLIWPSTARLFYEFAADPVVVWPFSFSGSTARCHVPAEEVAAVIEPRMRWQLVFALDSSSAGEPIDLGIVRIQG